jgi:DNA polymerase IV (DinB-like DNA polymerase)
VQGWARVVLHVDMDAFYASVEQARRPELRGQPLIIGADPMQGKGRGVVTTASYEARKFGVRSAMPISKAWQLCPQGIFLFPDFEHYGAVSERVMGVLREHADALESAGLDEAYLDVTQRAATREELEARMRGIQAAVRAAEGITCSVGAAQGKVTAKIASDLRKPEGVTVVPPAEAREVLAPLPARRIPGIGPKTEARLAEQGIERIGQIAELAWPRLQELFGSSAAYFRSVALGLDDSPVVPWTGPPRSIGNESTFLEDVADAAKLREEVRGLARHVAHRLEQDRLRARTVTLKVRFEDFDTHTRAQSVAHATRDAGRVERMALDLLEPFLAEGRAVRLLGVRASGLEADGGQTTLRRWLPDAP